MQLFTGYHLIQNYIGGSVRLLLGAVLLLVALPHIVSADMVYMKDGKSLEGEVLSVDETEIRILLPYGTLTVKRDDVQRIDFGPPEEKPEPPSMKRPEEKPKTPSTEEPEIPVKPGEEASEPREMKNPTTATMLALVPGGGYVYLNRWDLALAAVGAEVGLGLWGVSLVSAEGEGDRATGYVILGFAGLLKIVELFDTHERALDWNRSVSLGVGPCGKSFCAGVVAVF